MPLESFKSEGVVINGPSREELFDALRLHGECQKERRKVVFQWKDPQNVDINLKEAAILGIAAGDLCGEDWIVETYDGTQIRFNTHTRRGFIYFRR